MHATAPEGSATHGIVRAAEPQLSYTVPNAAKLLDISERKMWDLIGGDNPVIESIKIDGSRRIERHALEAYLASLRGAA